MIFVCVLQDELKELQKLFAVTKEELESVREEVLATKVIHIFDASTMP